MELREIETFLVLAEELHFGRAAERLRLSQGRVSQTIQTLERDVGGVLFDRSSRHVQLTSLGQEFHKGAERITEEVAATMRACRMLARGTGWRLHIGYSSSVGLEYVATLVHAFEAAYPDSMVVFNSMGIRVADPAESLVLNQGLDIGLLWCPGGDKSILASSTLAVGPVLAEDPRAVLLPAHHPLSDRTSVVLDDLIGCRIIDPGGQLIPAMREAWAPRVTPSGQILQYTADDLASMVGRPDINVSDIYPLVLAGHGLHFTVSSVLDRVPCPGIVAVQVADMPAAILVPVWRAGADNEGTHAFIEVARSIKHHP